MTYTCLKCSSVHSPDNVAAVCVECYWRLMNKLKKKDDALFDAIDRITAEYCSHPDDHGAKNNTCYAQFQFAALGEALSTRREEER